jgi:anti-sigma regulatory factor (Ser/Thr protein kinase)
VGVAVEHDLPKSTEAPALARDAVRGLEGYVPPDLVDDAALLISELVTNGVKYGGDGELKLQLEATPGRLRAEIVDQGSGFAPEMRADRDLSLEDEGGWGLHVVETVADEWGVYEGSTHVWFELRRGRD